MPIQATETIWMDGKLVPWNEAQVHVLTHTLHYGTGVFEGIRAYKTKSGTSVFRLTDHMRRLHKSAKVLMMDIPFSVEQLVDATKETIRENAAGPAKAAGDAGSVEQHKLTEQIAADKHLASKQAVGKTSRGLRFNKLVPPGAG